MPATPDDILLDLAHVSLVYEGDVRALDDVTLRVRRGERLVILGANGSGKSTLAGVLCGLLAPDAGDVALAGQRVCTDGEPDFDAYRTARRSLGLVFQNPDDQIVTSVVADDVAFGPENLAVPPEEIAARVARELHRVALDDYASADPTKLSGGQKQRVAIAGALAMEPAAIVFDEPGALLDVRGRRSILHVMDRLHAAGSTIVHITHFMEEALPADRVIVMDRGRIALEGTPAEVFTHGDELGRLGLDEPFAAQLAARLRAAGLPVAWTCDEDVLAAELASLTGVGSPSGEGMPLRGVLTPEGAKTSCTLETRPTASDSLGSRKPFSPLLFARTPENMPSPDGEPAIAVRDVVYSYHDGDARTDARPALDQVSFEVPAGSFCALIGQTGSGKSTLVRLVCALEAPDAGTIAVSGIGTSSKRDRRRLHGRVGYVMQHPERQLFAETVRQDVAFGPVNLRLSPDEIDRRVAHALALVGLLGKEDASPFELSGGQQRLCAIAGVLAMQPDVLVLDEPMAGLDPRGRRQVRDLLDDLHAHGITILTVTHSMDQAAGCDRVVVLNQSHVLMTGTPGEVFAPGNEAVLHDSGLGLPRALRFARHLDDLGVSGIGDPLTLDELTDALVRILAPTPATGDPRKEG